MAGVETRGRVGLGEESCLPPRREGSPRRVLNKMCHDPSRGLVAGTGNDSPYRFLQERVSDHGGGHDLHSFSRELLFLGHACLGTGDSWRKEVSFPIQ